MTTVAEETSETTVAPTATSRASQDSHTAKGQIVERAYIDASTRGRVRRAIEWRCKPLGDEAPRGNANPHFSKRASRLFTDLAQARGEGRLPRLMSTLERTPC